LPVIAIKLVFSIFFSLVIGGIYSNIGYSQASISNRTGALFFIVINQVFNNVNGVLDSFPSEKLIVSRERSGRAYNSLSYFCAKVIVELPLNILPSIVFGCIVYL
jgi:ABC-type multidrug transport system permease subunit